jgi:hypothetical protein
VIVLEKNTSSQKSGRTTPALEIRIHFTDGSTETFVQPEVEMAENILRQITPAHLFAQSRIVLADDYSKSVFVCSEINRIDFIYDGDGFSHLPDDHADLVEITGEVFNQHVPVNDPSRLDKRVQHRQVGDLFVSFHNLKMRGGSRVYLVEEKLVKLPADSQSYMQRYLSKGGLAVRLPGGGQSILNLANLMGYSVYPGVLEIPSDSWMARSKETYEILD